ncbi:MAG: PAS domain-containing sensor histidine kinase [Pseudomonadota bacterium]
MLPKQLLSTPSYFLFNSLQGRSLLLGIPLLLFLVVITISTRLQLIKQLDDIMGMSVELDQAHRGVNAIKYPLLRIESQIYLYLLSFDEHQKKLSQLYLQEVSYQSTELLKFSLIKKTPKLQKDLMSFLETFKTIEHEFSSVLKLTNKSQSLAQLSQIQNSKLRLLFQKNSNQITIMERRLELLSDKNLQLNHQLIRDISLLLWIFIGFLLCIFLVLFLVFEFWLRRPLVKLDNALTNIAEEGHNVELNYQGISEIDSLIDSFQNMQQQIRSRQQRISSILANAGEGIITIDTLGKIESFNKAAEQMFGLEADKVIAKNINIIMYGKHKAEHNDYIKGYLKTSQKHILGITQELTAIHKRGHHFPIEFTISELILEDKHLFIAVIHDISDRKKQQDSLTSAKEFAEETSQLLLKKNLQIQQSIEQLQSTQDQLIESEKMASLGGLVAGIAHEINTPVGVCITAASSLEQDIHVLNELISDGRLSKRLLMDFSEDSNESLRIILNNLSRAAELIRSFKQVAVDQSSDEKREFVLEDYLHEIILNLRPKLKKTEHKIEIICNKNIKVNSYPGAFSQVFTNLIMNSLIHAYDKGVWGIVSIEIKQQNNQLHIHYQDDGKGMTEEVISKIFDPFFTTQRGQGGSGLGMNVTYNLITSRLHGTIKCHSTPGLGTSFIIQCPVKV